MAWGRGRWALSAVPALLMFAATLAAPARAAWSVPVPVSDPGVTHDPTGVRVAADPAGDAGVVWADGGGAEREVAVSFRPAGGAFSPSTVLARSGVNSEPAISIGEGGSAIVAWNHVNGHGYAGTDLYLAAGQSNMEGLGEVPGPVPPPGTAREYRPQTDSLVELRDPVGAAKVGSSLPSFAIERSALTGRSAVIVDKAVGGTAQAAAADQGSGNWDASGKRWSEAVTATDAAIAKLEAIGETPVMRGVLWCQGERDAAAIGEGTISKAVYRAALEAMIARFRAYYGPTMPFYIFRTGRPRAHDTAGFEEVRSAQEEVAEDDPYTWVVFRGAVDFPAEGKMNPDPVKGELHYGQAGYNEMGEIGADGVVAAEAEQEGGWIEPEAGRHDAGPVRTNLWRDPLSASGVGFARLGPGTLLAASTEESFYGAGSTKVIAPPGGSLGAQTANPRPAVSPGLPYAFSAEIDGAAGKRLLLSMRWLGPGGALIGSSKREIILTGGWERFSLAALAPAEAAAVDARVQTTAQTEGATYYLDGVQLEQAAAAGEFFPTPAELESGAARWSAAANESASELGGGADSIEARTRSGSQPFGPIRALVGPLRDDRVGIPDVGVLDDGEDVAAFTHSGGSGSTRVGASEISESGAIATLADLPPGSSPIGDGQWRGLAIGGASDGSAVIVAQDGASAGRIVPAARAGPGQPWKSGDPLAVGSGAGAGCLCGDLPSIARLPNGKSAIVFGRGADLTAEDSEFGEFTINRAMTDAAPDKPPILATTLNAPSDAGGPPRIAADASGALLVAWISADGRVLTRYRPPWGSFGSTELAGTGADGDFGLALDPKGEAFIVYASGGAIEAMRRPAGAGAAWREPQDLSAPAAGPHSIAVAAGAGEAELAFIGSDGQERSRVFVSTFAPG